MILTATYNTETFFTNALGSLDCGGDRAVEENVEVLGQTVLEQVL